MRVYSIQATLPVNVIIKARSKKDAEKRARNRIELPYEPAGDIQIADNPHIFCLRK